MKRWFYSSFFFALAIIVFGAIFSFTLTSEVAAQSIDGTTVTGPSLALTKGIRIVLDPSESPAIKKAAADLQRDLQKVLGQSSPIVDSPSLLQASESAIIITSKGATTTVFRDTTLTSEEGHTVFTKTSNEATHIVLQGADTRGAIYAIYSFSERMLGVPPLWYWMGWTPTVQQTIAVPANSGFRVENPQVKYRVWFMNNQDLFGDWAPPQGSNHRYDMVYETMLRQKLNTFYVGESLGEYGSGRDTVAQLATERGLIVASNALTTFRQWDTYWADVKKTAIPALTLANKALFDEYWKYSIQYAKDRNFDVLWILSFRGRSDQSFWEAMPDAPLDAAQRGDIIESMVTKQMGLVRNTTGNSNPRMAFQLWNEVTDLAVAGKIQPPADPDLIWLYSNDVRDHFPRSDVRTYPLPTNQLLGYYLNLQFYSTGSHLVEGEGIWKTAQNFKVVANRRAGGKMGIGMLNVGNVREFLLTSTAASEMFWNINSFNPDTGMKTAFKEAFGINDTTATSLVTSYKTMLNAYWKQKSPDVTDIERQYLFHDLRIAKAINEQLAKLKAKQRDLNLFLSDTYRVNPSYTNATTPVGAVMNGSKTASNSFETVVADLTAKKASIPTNRQQFYIDSVLSQAQFLSAAHATLYNVTRAHFILSSDPAGARCHLQSALTSSQTMQSALRQSAHDDFSTWYQGESLFGLTDMQNSINATIPLYPSSSCTTSSTTPPPATPTPTPISLIQAAYPSTPTSASTVKDGKRTVIQAKTTSTLKQIACFGCGTGSTIRVNNSTSSFTIGTQIFSGTTSSVSSSWGIVSVNIPLTAGSYYVVQFVPTTTPVYYGTTAPSYTNFAFLRYATDGAPTWKTGAWQIRLTYTK